MLARAGQVISELLGEVEEGAALVSRAINLDPNLAIARYSRGGEHLFLGDVDAALEQFHVAVRLSPLDPLLFFAQTGMAYAHFMAGRYDEGSSWAGLLSCSDQIIWTHNLFWRHALRCLDGLRKHE